MPKMSKRNRSAGRRESTDQPIRLLGPEAISQENLANLPAYGRLEPLIPCTFDKMEHYVHELLREKDARIELLMQHNAELSHHIRNLERLIDASCGYPGRREEKGALGEAVISESPQEGQNINISFSLVDDEEWQSDMTRRDELQTLAETSLPMVTISNPALDSTGTLEMNDELTAVRELEQKLEREKEAKKKVIQEFMELSSQIGEKEEELRAELVDERAKLEEAKMRLSLAQRHLEDIKAAKLDLKKEHESLLEELARERARPWWKKLLGR
jgi:hypothetical protein